MVSLSVDAVPLVSIFPRSVFQAIFLLFSATVFNWMCIVRKLTVIAFIRRMRVKVAAAAPSTAGVEQMVFAKYSHRSDCMSSAAEKTSSVIYGK